MNMRLHGTLCNCMNYMGFQCTTRDYFEAMHYLNTNRCCHERAILSRFVFMVAWRGFECVTQYFMAPPVSPGVGAGARWRQAQPIGARHGHFLSAPTNRRPARPLPVCNALHGGSQGSAGSWQSGEEGITGADTDTEKDWGVGTDSGADTYAGAVTDTGTGAGTPWSWGALSPLGSTDTLLTSPGYSCPLLDHNFPPHWGFTATLCTSVRLWVTLEIGATSFPQEFQPSTFNSPSLLCAKDLGTAIYSNQVVVTSNVHNTSR